MAQGARRAFALAVCALALPAAGCSGARHGPGSSPNRQSPPAVPPSPLNELSYAVAAVPPSNWNILAAGTDAPALAPVADQLWPSVFSFGPDFNPVLNTTLVQSATVTSVSPQTVVYRINPKAIWSDGTPVSGADFVYNWQAQSGRGGIPDAGGKSFTPAGTSGYSQVQSVAVGTSTPDVVTVVFATPDPDWSELFRHIVPAHVAQQVGFDTGFTDPVTDLVSAGPYVVASYDPSGIVHLVRNPSYDGAPPAALELDVHYLPDTDQLTTAVAAGELSCAEVPATTTALSALKSTSNLRVTIGSAATYLDLVFDEQSGAMKDPAAREEIARSLSRSAVISSALAGVAPQEAPIANRFLVPNEAGYVAGGLPTDTAGKVPAGQSVPLPSLRLVVASADPTAAASGQAVAQQLEAAGIAVTVSQVGDPSEPNAGHWDLALVARQMNPWPSVEMAPYRSGAAGNIGGAADPSIDADIAASMSASGAQRTTLIDGADTEAWSSLPDLPILPLPSALACQTDVTGPAPNASPDGPAYNASSWGLSPGSS